jgi:hypothetical protein
MFVHQQHHTVPENERLMRTEEKLQSRHFSDYLSKSYVDPCRDRDAIPKFYLKYEIAVCDVRALTDFRLGAL